MQRNPRKLFWILIATVLILVAAVVTAMNWDHRVSASGGGPGQGPSGWRLAQPVTYENLTIFPVVAAQDADTSEFATLDEGLAHGDVVIAEQGDYLRRTRDGNIPPNLSSGPQVNQLVLINRGKRPLILLAGEVVSGGKQDRIIGKDRIVPIGAAPLPLDVFCVEHGRWTGESNQFSAARLMVHPSVREEAAFEQSQTQVWAAVRGEAKSVGSGNANAVAAAPPPALTQRALSSAIDSAGTQSYQKIYKSSPIGVSVETFADEINRRFDRATAGLKGERVVGVVVAFGDEAAWSDIFASSELFDAYWPKLLRSYVVEAMTRPGVRQTASLEEARDFLRPVTGRIEEESEPGIYEWRKQSLGRLAEIELEALAPKPLTLHYLRVLRSDNPAGVLIERQVQ
jgi:hypothetical protein